MLKLFYSAGSCSTSCHIALEEAGVKYEAVEVDWDKAADPNLVLVTKLNPLGTLPVLMTDQEQILSQNIAIHIHVAALAPEKALLPKAGTPEHAEAMNWLSFVATDLHKAFNTLFALQGISSEKPVQDAVAAWSKGNVNKYLGHMNRGLAGKDYLLGKDFCVADAYAFVVTNWVQWVGMTLDEYPNVMAFMKRVANRPAVKRVIEQEGIQGEVLGAS